MAAYNTGPFDNDYAQDLLGLYAELTVEERLANLRVVFAGGIRHPGGPLEPVDPCEVLAGAALIALALPGGQQVREIPQMDFAEEIAAAAIPPPDTELVRLALHALRKVTADGRSVLSWLYDTDREASRHAVEVVVDVLATRLAATSTSG